MEPKTPLEARAELYSTAVTDELRSTGAPDTLEERVHALLWRHYDRPLAPTSETALWGRWCDRRREGLPADQTELLEEAAWWIDAYRSLGLLTQAQDEGHATDEDAEEFWQQLDNGFAIPDIVATLLDRLGST